MPMIDALLPEYDHEMATTRKLLERVPDDRLAWKPHEKSMTLGRLAMHVAELPNWVEVALEHDGIDLDPGSYVAKSASSRQDLLAVFDKAVKDARALIVGRTDAEMLAPWTLRQSGEAVFTLPKSGVIRTWVLNHMIHHRGQLSVYLRLNGVPLPSIYGPSADEK